MAAQRRGKVVGSPSEDDLDFDPMREAYANEEFNSYSRGPGSFMKPSMHVESRRKNDQGNVKLHVTNIPANISEKGLKSIFSNAGAVQSIYIGPIKPGAKTKWGFVEFKTVKEAHDAIYRIGNEPPHCLTVKFAYNDEEKTRRHKETFTPSVDHSSDDSLVGGRGRGLLPPLRGQPPQSFKSTREPPELFYDQDKIDDGYSMGQFQHYNGETPEDFANEAIGSLTLSVNLDGTRKVSMGRGSSITDSQVWSLPRVMSKKDVENYVMNAYFTERYDNTFVYSNDETVLTFPLLKCTNCGGSSRRKCYNCGLPYCSKKCVNSDWPRHKENCFGVKHEVSKFDGSVDEKTVPDSDHNSLDKENSSPRELHQPEKVSPEKKERDFGNRNAKIAHPTVIKKMPLENCVGTQLSPDLSTLKALPQPPKPKHKRSQEKISDKNSVKNSKAVMEKAPIPHDSFTKVCISSCHSESMYWVVAEANIAVQSTMTEKLNKHCKGPDAKALEKPEINSKCAALYCNEWFRGAIRQIKPKIKVHFIDFGNDEFCKPNEILALPKDFLSPPPMAFLVKFAEGTSGKYKNLVEYEMVSIKPINKIKNNKDPFHWIVEIEGETYPTRPEAASETSSSNGSVQSLERGVSSPKAETVRPLKSSMSSLGSKEPDINPIQTRQELNHPRSSPSFQRKSGGRSPLLNDQPSKENKRYSNGPSGRGESPMTPTPTPIKNITPPRISSPTAVKAVNKHPLLEAEEPSNDSTCPIPFDCFTEVTVSYRERPWEYWVNLKSDVKNIFQMTQQLGDCSSQKIDSPKVGETYVCQYTDVWCRAQVVSLDPIKVFYIDFGNEEVVSAQDLRPVPPHFYGSPPFAFPIKLADGTSNKYSDLIEEDISIKPLFKLNNGTWMVIVEGETYENLPAKPPSFRNTTEKKTMVKHLLSLVSDGMKGVELVVNKVFNEEHITCTLQLPSHPDSYTPQMIEQQLRKLRPQPIKSAQLGDNVCCITSNGVIARGYVMSVVAKQFRVALIDYARVCPISKLCPLPADIQEIPETGVRLVFYNEQAKSLEKGAVIKCKNVTRLKDGFDVEIEGMTGTALLSTWEPRVEEGGLSAVEIPSGSSVVMSSFKSPQAIYVQSLVKEHIDNLNTVIQDTASSALKAGRLNRKPLSGEVVACLFVEDNNYYRAQIIKRIKDKFIVTFLDYGNTAEVSIEDLKPLEDSLKMVPCSAVKVGLKGVDVKVLTPEAMKYLNNLNNEGVQFILEYDNSDLSNVSLETKDGLHLNTKINDLIDPNWKKCLEEGKDPSEGAVFMAKDAIYLDWKEGSLKDLAIISTVNHNHYMVLDTKDGNVEFISGKFTDQLTEYCESFKPNCSYNPRPYELCIAKYKDDGKWYRAICMKPFKVSSEVLFLDFGNGGEVLHRDIRQMTADFVKIPILLKECAVYGVPDKVSETSAKKLKDFFCENSSHQAVITEENHDGIVVAYFPDLVVKTTEFGIPEIRPPSL